MLRELFSALLDIVAPPRATERVVGTLHSEILRALSPEGALPYHEPRVTALVWELKYYASKRAALLAAAHLSDELLGVISEEVGRPLLVPVPMHASRRSKRGHNQTEVLCKALLPYVKGGVEYAPHALLRVRDTPMQQGLTRTQRIKNLQKSMRANAAVAGRVCIVIDDVTTTGATLAEAKRALQVAGARVIHTIVLAKP